MNFLQVRWVRLAAADQSKAKAEDIVFLAEIIEDPLLLFVLNTSRFKDLKSLLAYAKENPNLLACGFATVGDPEHIATGVTEKGAALFNKVGFGSGAASAGYGIIGGTWPLRLATSNEQWDRSRRVHNTAGDPD